MDLFIGDPNYLHKGLGSIILRTFMKEYVFPQLHVDVCIIGPDPKNLIAIKAYQKAGFKHFKTIFTGKEDEHLMKITRQELTGA